MHKIVVTEQLTKRFAGKGGEVIAVDGVDLDVTEGEFLAIMGPSGSGKSTLLHLLGGLEMPSQGRIVLDGSELSLMSDDEITTYRRKNIGIVLQAFNLLPTMTAEENVAVPLLMNGTSRSAVNATVQEMLDSVGVASRAGSLPAELSGGEAQRVAIARALITNPRLVLANEPTGNLDSKNKIEILQLLKQMSEIRKKTIIMVTHDADAANYATQTIRLKDGRIESNA